jgi:MFS family permease
VTLGTSDPAVGRLFRTTFLFGLGCGISVALTALYLDARGFGKQDIGTLAAWFASGIVLAALPAGALMRSLSPGRVLPCALAGYALSVVAFPFAEGYAQVAAVRFLDGVCSVVIWVSSETLLLSRAGPSNKAHLTSLYAVYLALGYGLGPLLARVAAAASVSQRAAFLTAAALAAAAALHARPLGAAARAVAPPAGREGEGAAPAGHGRDGAGSGASAWQILWRIKIACFATFAYGYFQASVVLFLPLYLIESKGVARERTIVLPGLFCLGMLLFSNAVGRLGDRAGHLRVMRGLALVGGSMILGFVYLDAYPLMCAAVFVAGATLAAMSSVSLALQGASVDPRDLPRSNALYNLFYAAGILGGPPASSALFSARGGAAMLYHLAAIYGAFLAFSVAFRRDDPSRRKALAQGAPDEAPGTGPAVATSQM